VGTGATILKSWLQIDKDVKLERFKNRQNNPEKIWKITYEDWRNRYQWAKYKIVVDDMLQKTSTTTV
jgi:polyphosphate kinase 2 (PPK2 family)